MGVFLRECLCSQRDCVEALPTLVLGARGGRAGLAKQILGSAECKQKGCGKRGSLGDFICLGHAGCVEAGRAATAKGGNSSAAVDGANSKQYPTAT